MKLKAITYNYIQDGILHNKVIGIFTEEQLSEVWKDIINLFTNEKCNIINQSGGDNLYMEFDDVNKTYFYSGDYIVGELYL